MQDDTASEVVGHPVTQPAQVPGVGYVHDWAGLDLDRRHATVGGFSDNIYLTAAAVSEVMQPHAVRAPGGLAVQFVHDEGLDELAAGRVGGARQRLWVLAEEVRRETAVGDVDLGASGSLAGKVARLSRWPSATWH